MTVESLALQTTPIITFGYIMQVFFSLLIIVALIYFFGRFALPRMKFNTTGKIIKIIDRVYLEPQVSAYILQVGKSQWLVGVSNKQINCIDKLSEESIALNG